MTTQVGETAALIALLRDGRRSWAHYAADVAEAGSAVPVLAAEHGLLAADLADRAGAELSAWEQRGIRVLTWLDPQYPPRLRAVRDAPPVLFLSGSLTPADRQAVAVIGSRRPSETGRSAARAIAARLVADGYTVISGLAAGIDAEAHGAALQAGGRTVAVLGNGLDHVYPAENSALQRSIATRCAVISQFWPETRPSRLTFPLRNGVMAGLSVATVIVEASQMSGTRIQARLALEQSRLVILLASLLEQPWAAELAARPGVEVVRSPDDVVMAVQDRLGAEAATAEPQPIS